MLVALLASTGCVTWRNKFVLLTGCLWINQAWSPASVYGLQQSNLSWIWYSTTDSCSLFSITHSSTLFPTEPDPDSNLPVSTRPHPSICPSPSFLFLNFYRLTYFNFVKSELWVTEFYFCTVVSLIRSFKEYVLWVYTHNRQWVNLYIVECTHGSTLRKESRTISTVITLTDYQGKTIQTR